jgi:hypothetical protein
MFSLIRVQTQHPLFWDMVAVGRDAMNLSSVLLTIAALAVGAYFGVLRPTGLAGRTRAEREQDDRRDLASKWLNKTDRHE